MKRICSQLLILFVVAGVAFSCSKNAIDPPVVIPPTEEETEEETEETEEDTEEQTFTLNETEVRLHYDEEFVFSVANATAVTWSSSDEFVGTIAEDGRFSASHIGETTITASIGGIALTARVIVEPYITTISEPLLLFGAAINEIRTLETRSLITETPTTLTYSGQNASELGVSYTFVSSNLVSSSIHFDGSLAGNLETFNTFYAERYLSVDLGEEFIMFLSREQDIVIMQDISDEIITANYLSIETAEFGANVRTRLQALKKGAVPLPNRKR